MVHETLEEGVQVSALSLPRLMTPQGEGCLQTLAKLEEKEARTPRGDGGEHQSTGDPHPPLSAGNGHNLHSSLSPQPERRLICTMCTNTPSRAFLQIKSDDIKRAPQKRQTLSKRPLLPLISLPTFSVHTDRHYLLLATEDDLIFIENIATILPSADKKIFQGEWNANLRNILLMIF